MYRQNIHISKGSHELDDILEAVTAGRRPELTKHSKTRLKLFLQELCRLGFSLSALLSAIDDWNEDDESNAPELVFGEAAHDTLIEFLGETAARLVIYEVGEALHDPDMFARRITELLGSGASAMLNRIVHKRKTGSSSTF